MEYRIEPPLWNVSLTHDELENIEDLRKKINVIPALSFFLDVLAIQFEYWRLVCAVGGHGGVSITGTTTIPTQTLAVPSNVAFFADLAALIAKLPSGVPLLVGAAMLHNPLLGWLGLGQLVKGKFGSERGKVRCDEEFPGDDEPVQIISHPDGSHSILTHVGYLSLDDDTNHDHGGLGNTVHAYGEAIDDIYARWDIVQHPGDPASVAIRSRKNGLHLIHWGADQDFRVSAEAVNPGIGECWRIVLLGSSFGLRTPQVNPPGDPESSGLWKYLSVAD